MFKTLKKIIGGDPVKKRLDEYTAHVDAINALEPTMQSLSRDELKAKTAQFRARLEAGETLDDLLVEAFAVVREVSVRTIGLRHFDVQLVGAVLLHEGIITEMKTGEGKTLVATMPMYLNALEGRGVHLVTVNDYLARRDARWMGPIFHFLGLSVGVLQEAARTEGGRKAFLYDPERESSQEDIHQLQLVDRKQAYQADVTYGTNNEFGFDYLRDNMARSLAARSQRGHHYAILDEVDNILIDEARTPLIISGPSHEDPELYEQMARVVNQLRPEDFEVSEKDRTVALTAIGEDHVERLISQPLRDLDRPEDITPEQARLLGHIEQAMRAEYLFKRNKDYVVQSGRVIIVDHFTGRMMPGRRWSDGLHQAVEAKENVRVRQENVTYATITLQNYFRMYQKLAGMTGTAVTEAEEFNKIYGVDVLPLPTNLEYIAMQEDSDLEEVDYREGGNNFVLYARKDDPEHTPIFWKRKDYPDVVFRTEESKLRAVTTEILSCHVQGRPLLVGTTSVELSEKISGRLRTQPLRTLANILVLRDAYMEAHGIPDDGMRVEGLEPLYTPIESLKSATIRSLARPLKISLNPNRPENRQRLMAVVGIDPQYEPQLQKVLDSGISHNVLNAKKHDEESRIIADAGALGAVTIATNMAGRGVDIKLGGEIAEEVLATINRVLRRMGIEDPENLNLEERLEALQKADAEAIGIYDSEVKLFRKFMEGGKQVKEVGGLHVIGSERHEARRIDNQLRGRAARQGDPGSSQFFLSLEDELMRLFGGSQVSNMMSRLNIDDAVPIAHNLVNRTIEQAQTRVEGANFDTRKHLLEYDDVLNQQREVFYSQRNRVFGKEDLRADVAEMLSMEVERHVQNASLEPEAVWKLLAWLEETQPTLNIRDDDPYPSFMLRKLLESLEGVEDLEALRVEIIRTAKEALAAQHDHLQQSVQDHMDRAIERLDDQVSQRVEMAEIAMEGVELEAEEHNRELDSQALIRAVEQSAGLKIRLDQSSQDRANLDIMEFRRQVPDLIEASMALRVWAGLVNTVQRRIGQELPLESSLQIPLDWDSAMEALHTAMDQAWAQRVEKLETDIGRDLDAALRKESEVTEALKLRLLIQVSYGQEMFFDRKTHQKRTATVARFSYAYSAARLLDLADPEALIREIIDHLEGAQEALAMSLGRAELHRLGRSHPEALDERLVSTLRSELKEEFDQIAESDTLASLPSPMKEKIAQILGERRLTEAYRVLILSVGDRIWVDYLTQIEALRTSIGLEAYGQRDPLVQYKSRAYDMFQSLLADIRAGVVHQLFRAQAPRKTSSSAPQPSRSSPGTSPTSGASKPRKRKRRRRRH